MLHAEPLSPQPWFSEDHQSLPGRDHFLHVMQIEPAENQRLAQRIRIRILQRRLENLLPTAEPDQACIDDFAAKKNWQLTFLARKRGKLGAILVATRKMGQEILSSFDLQTAQRSQFRARNPVQFGQRLRQRNHSIGADARSAST